MQTAMARGEVGAFSRRLEELKEAGSMLLVKGGEAGPRAAVSTRLLGHNSEKRVPLFVLLGRDRSVIDNRLPGSKPVDEIQIIESAFTRSAAASSPDASAPTDRRLDSLEYLLNEISGAVESIETRQDEPFATGELRICLDSMIPIIDRFEREAVEAFLAALRNLVRNYAAMAHAIVPLFRVPDRYDWLEAAFDVVIDTRTADGVPQERWRLPDDDLATGWFYVNETEAV